MLAWYREPQETIGSQQSTNANQSSEGKDIAILILCTIQYFYDKSMKNAQKVLLSLK